MMIPTDFDARLTFAYMLKFLFVKSPSIGWIVIKLDVYNHAPLRMNCNDFVDLFKLFWMGVWSWVGVELLPVRTSGHSELSKPPERHDNHVSNLTLAFLKTAHQHGSQVSVAAVQLQVI